MLQLFFYLSLIFVYVCNAGSIFENQNHNVVLIIADDMGFENLSMNKNENNNPQSEFPSTPNLDSLAAQGVRFTRAFAEPVCSSSRATLLTGRHPFRHGIGTILIIYICCVCGFNTKAKRFQKVAFFHLRHSLFRSFLFRNRCWSKTYIR
jgi:hypothetical protein